MTELDRKLPDSAPENAPVVRWNHILHQLLFNTELDEMARRRDFDAGGLCDILLESFEPLVRAANGPDALRVLCDACDSIDLEPSAACRLLDDLAWLSEESNAPVDDLLFEGLRDAHLAGDAVIEELVRTFDYDPYEGLGSNRFELLIRICRWAIKNQSQPERVAERLLDVCTQRSPSSTVNPSRPPSVSTEQAPVLVDLALQEFQETLEQADDPMRLLDTLAEVCSKQIPDPQSAGDPTPHLILGSLTEVCIDTIVAAGNSRRAADMLWEAYNAAMFDDRHLWLEEMMEAYRDAIHAIKDPIYLVDTLFGALPTDETVQTTTWSPDADFVAYACLEAIEAGGGPRAAVDAALAAVGSFIAESYDELATVKLLCRLYGEVRFGSHRSDEALRQSVEVLERIAVSTRELDETIAILFEGLSNAAREHDDPGRCAGVLFGTIMCESDAMDTPWSAVESLMDDAMNMIKRGSHQTRALNVLLEALGKHRASGPLVLLGSTALVATSSGDWSCRRF